MYQITAERLDGQTITSKHRDLVAAQRAWNRELARACYRVLILREDGRTLRTWTLTAAGATLEK